MCYHQSMPPRLLTGREPADTLLQSLQSKIRSLDPKLVIVQVGEIPESDAYIQAKLRSCQRVGLRSDHRRFPAAVTRDDLINVLQTLNADRDVTGYLLQLPLPETLWRDFPLITRAMDPAKDVDGMTAYNLGKLFLSRDFEHLPPATPAGVLTLLDHYDITVEGKQAVIVGRSTLVGKPLSVMLLHRNATVTVCHSHTADLALHAKRADILLCAVGKPGLITASMIKEGAVVIDIGLTRTDEGFVGDVDFEAVKNIASAITPVPGGVGPMTVASLIRNVVTAKERQLEKKEGTIAFAL